MGRLWRREREKSAMAQWLDVDNMNKDTYYLCDESAVL